MMYKIIYADPPWKFKNKNTGGSMNSGSVNKYNVMSIEDICNLDINSISDDNCVLFMWWIASMPRPALRVMDEWGFTLKTMTGFTWIKKTKNWKDFFGMGFQTRQQSENCIIATKGKIKRVNAGVRQLIYAKNTLHSKKPLETKDRIIKLYGDLPRIELFAREKTHLFDVWGNEIDNDIIIKNK